MAGVPDTDYDPEASDTILTICPGCGNEIVVFQSGEIAEQREEPLGTGVIPTSLLHMAFKSHYCEANDREWVCHHCKNRYETEERAKSCCLLDAPQEGYSLVCNYEE